MKGEDEIPSRWVAEEVKKPHVQIITLTNFKRPGHVDRFIMYLYSSYIQMIYILLTCISMVPSRGYNTLGDLSGTLVGSGVRTYIQEYIIQSIP